MFRYYYDPPEFQTVITTTDTKEDSGLPHIGYFRDNPKVGKRKGKQQRAEKNQKKDG